MTKDHPVGDRVTSYFSLLLLMGVWQGVAMDSLKFHMGLPCPTLLRPVGKPTLKQPYSRFWGGLPTGQTA
jgi:hypothetical protein